MLLYINQGGGHSSQKCYIQDDADSQASTAACAAMTNDLANVESTRTTVYDVPVTPRSEEDDEVVSHVVIVEVDTRGDDVKHV